MARTRSTSLGRMRVSCTQTTAGAPQAATLTVGSRVALSLGAERLRAAERPLGESEPVQGAAFIVSVDDGRVLAMAGRHRATPAANDVKLATSPWAPAAFVFKMVTTA